MSDSEQLTITFPDLGTPETRTKVAKAWLLHLYQEAPYYVLEQIAHTAAKGDANQTQHIFSRLINAMQSIKAGDEIEYTEEITSPVLQRTIEIY